MHPHTSALFSPRKSIHPSLYFSLLTLLLFFVYLPTALSCDYPDVSSAQSAADRFCTSQTGGNVNYQPGSYYYKECTTNTVTGVPDLSCSRIELSITSQARVITASYTFPAYALCVQGDTYSLSYSASAPIRSFCYQGCIVNDDTGSGFCLSTQKVCITDYIATGDSCPVDDYPPPDITSGTGGTDTTGGTGTTDTTGGTGTTGTTGGTGTTDTTGTTGTTDTTGGTGTTDTTGGTSSGGTSGGTTSSGTGTTSSPCLCSPTCGFSMLCAPGNQCLIDDGKTTYTCAADGTTATTSSGGTSSGTNTGTSTGATTIEGTVSIDEGTTGNVTNSVNATNNEGLLQGAFAAVQNLVTTTTTGDPVGQGITAGGNGFLDGRSAACYPTSLSWSGHRLDIDICEELAIIQSILYWAFAFYTFISVRDTWLDAIKQA